MKSVTITFPTEDLAQAAGHVRAALERAGLVDVCVIKSNDGFVARGIQGSTPLAVLSFWTPLRFFGWFSRCFVEVCCARSLNEGDTHLRQTTRVMPLAELADMQEINWVTRGPVEMYGDAKQGGRVLRNVMQHLTGPLLDAPGEAFDSLHPAERRERFQARYQRGKQRRNRQMAAGLAVIALSVAMKVGLDL